MKRADITPMGAKCRLQLAACAAACRMLRKRTLGSVAWIQVLLASFTLSAATLSAAEAATAPAPEAVDLMSMDLDALSKVTVTSVSKKAQKMSDVGAAVTVLTGEDVQRMGAATVPEALRQVPGLDVAQINASTWSISARGFGGQWANKLLVLMDGRSVYNPLFAGTYWDVQDTLMEDIDRIEVIRGPGATVWGANAVNGVINIVSKSAKDTLGGLVTVSSGTERNFGAGARYGAKVGENLYLRVYGKGDIVDVSEPIKKFTGPQEGDDGYNLARGGARLDWHASEDSIFTLQGDVYGGEENVTDWYPTPVNPLAVPVPGLPSVYHTFVDQTTEVFGANVLGRWDCKFSDTSSLTLQAYFDHTDRSAYILEEKRDTFDFEAHHSFGIGERHSVIWGLGYRYSQDSTEGSYSVQLTPSDDAWTIASGFIQDEIALVPDKLTVTLGTKLEMNDVTGFEVQPSARAVWKPTEKQTVWAAASRAVRTPSRTEDAFILNTTIAYSPFPPPGGYLVPRVLGNTELESEELWAYELGYRIQASKHVSFDLAGYYNDYDNLLSAMATGAPTFEFGPPGVPGHAVLGMRFNNALEGAIYGFELSSTIQPVEHWRLIPFYALSVADMHPTLAGADDAEVEERAPIHQAGLRSMLDFAKSFHLDAALRYVDNVPDRDVAAYVELDARFAWNPTKSLELAIIGQNLLDASHQEATADGYFIYEVARAVSGKVTFKF